MNSITSAVSAVIEDGASRVLLCQQSQGHRLWCLPGGRVRRSESPVAAAVRDIREETGIEVEIVDLIGLYHLTGGTCGEHLPDLALHVFRAKVIGGEAAVNAPGRISRLAWYDPTALPDPLTATAQTAIADELAGRSGVIRNVQRNVEPEVPEAVDAR